MFDQLDFDIEQRGACRTGGQQTFLGLRFAGTVQAFVPFDMLDVVFL